MARPQEIRWVSADFAESCDCHRFHGPPHDRVVLQDRVKVVSTQREQVAVSVSSDACHAFSVGQEADFFSEIFVSEFLFLTSHFYS